MTRPGATSRSRPVRRLTNPPLPHPQYGIVCEVTGRSLIAPEAFNCKLPPPPAAPMDRADSHAGSAPDTGNMELLARYGTPAQCRRWLVPLLAGAARSCFAMTEPAVSSSDATNMRTAVRRTGDGYAVAGRKWWTSGAMDSRAALCIVMAAHPEAEGRPRHRRHSMLLVPMEQVEVVRPLPVFGYLDAPHGHAETAFDCEVPADGLLGAEGGGFEMAQARLGPGRLHHCMRLIGMAERALELACRRGLSREAFGRPIARMGAFQNDLAKRRVALDGARLLVLAAADDLDKRGNKEARKALAIAKVAAPNAALAAIDFAIQAHGAAGVCDDFPLAAFYAGARTLRIADGPDEVHLGTIAKAELSRAKL